MGRLQDPRLYQISVLGGLLAYGVAALDFDIGPGQVALTLASVVVSQWAWSRGVGLPRVDLRSALISGLSLCLLLRTGRPEVYVPLAAFAAVGSKFVIRVRGKHVFNPTNLGLVALLLVSPHEVWVSPGQWGNVAFFAALMACLGGMVVHRALRSDVALAFMAAYGVLLASRSLYLGEPMAIPLHRLQNGALLLFTFFMISDPRTTPDSRAGRVLFGVVVALGACYVQFGLFRTNGLLWSLAACAPLVPLLDRLLPGDRYVWPGRRADRGARAGSAAVARARPLPAPSSTHPSVPRSVAAERIAS